MHALQAFRYAERLFHSQFVRLDFHRLECRGKHFNHIDVALFENVQSFLNHGLRIQHTKHVIFLELPPIIRHVEHGHSTEPSSANNRDSRDNTVRSNPSLITKT